MTPSRICSNHASDRDRDSDSFRTPPLQTWSSSFITSCRESFSPNRDRDISIFSDFTMVRNANAFTGPEAWANTSKIQYPICVDSSYCPTWPYHSRYCGIYSTSYHRLAVFVFLRKKEGCPCHRPRRDDACAYRHATSIIRAGAPPARRATGAALACEPAGRAARRCWLEADDVAGGGRHGRRRMRTLRCTRRTTAVRRVPRRRVLFASVPGRGMARAPRRVPAGGGDD